jgi:hypothetical protein
MLTLREGHRPAARLAGWCSAVLRSPPARWFRLRARIQCCFLTGMPREVVVRSSRFRLSRKNANVRSRPFAQPHAGPAVLTFAARVGLAENPDTTPPVRGEGLAGRGCLAGLQQFGVERVIVLGLLDEPG